MKTQDYTMEQAKKSYDYLYNGGMAEHDIATFYPQLTGDWEEDKDFWYEEHCEQMDRMRDTN